jgi:peroxiredoxin
VALLLLLPPLWARDQPDGDRPATAAGEYKALVAGYAKADKESDEAYNKARADEERQKLRAAWLRTRSEFHGRFLAFAEAHPKDKEALLALFFVLHLDSEAEARHLDAAGRLILTDHIASAHLTNPPILQLLDDSPAGERLLRGVLEKSPHRAVRAQAGLSLGLMLNGRAHPRRADARPPENAAALAKEAEALFERVTTESGDVGEVAERAKDELFEIRRLAIGKIAPDITGTDSAGKEFKLSDFCGKVVVLDFWADWCVPCMAMVPHQRALTERLKGKPFALVGVSRNKTREGLQRCEEKHGMTWRSFFDGQEGPISKRYNVKLMPTVYVLDAKGVIRYKGVKGEALDRAVDELLKELEGERR